MQRNFWCFGIFWSFLESVRSALLGTYLGPGGRGEVITVTRDQPIAGKFVTIEQAPLERVPINLLEVQIFEKVPPLGKRSNRQNKICCLLY